MKLEYSELVKMLNCFKTNADGEITFTDPRNSVTTPIYQSHVDAGIKYLKYVYYPQVLGYEISAIQEPLTIIFPDEYDPTELYDASHPLYPTEEAILNVIAFSMGSCNILYEGVGELFNTFRKKVGFVNRTPEYYFGVQLNGCDTPQGIFNLIRQRVQELCSSPGSNFQPGNFNGVYITEYVAPNVIYELKDLLSKSDEYKYTILYQSQDYYTYMQDQRRFANFKAHKLFAESSNSIMFDDSILTPYKDFASDYNKYIEVYDIVCDWVKENVKTQGRCIVGADTCEIPFIHILLAWVTITTGVVFIFTTMSEDNYNTAIESFLRGELLPSDLKFKMLNIQPKIRDRFLLGVSRVGFGSTRCNNGAKVNTLVALKDISYPVKSYKGVPLKYIISEIMCNHEEDSPIKGMPSAGFHMKHPKFTNIASVVKDSTMKIQSAPLSVLDIVIGCFNEHREDVLRYFGTRIIDPKIVKAYADDNCEELLQQYIYYFELIFSHYMGYDKFYTLNDIYIFEVDNEYVACTLEYEPVYTAHAIDFYNGAAIVDSEEMRVSNILSPQYLADYQLVQEHEDGSTTVEINEDIKQAIRAASNAIASANSGSALQIKTEAAGSAELTDDMLSYYLYPVVWADSMSTQGDVITINEDLIEDLKIFFTEYLYAEYNRSAVRKARYSEESDMPLKERLKRLIVRELCNHKAQQDREIFLPQLFNSDILSYKGLRYLTMEESPIYWTGELKRISQVNPAMIKRRR